MGYEDDEKCLLVSLHKVANRQDSISRYDVDPVALNHAPSVVQAATIFLCNKFINVEYVLGADDDRDNRDRVDREDPSSNF